MIKLPFNVIQASEETINALIAVGALHVDENGIHASEPGTYPRKIKYPCQ